MATLQDKISKNAEGLFWSLRSPELFTETRSFLKSAAEEVMAGPRPISTFTLAGRKEHYRSKSLVMGENKRMKPGVKKGVECSRTAGSSIPQWERKCCGIKDAGYKGEQLKGKWRMRRSDMMGLHSNQVVFIWCLKHYQHKLRWNSCRICSLRFFFTFVARQHAHPGCSGIHWWLNRFNNTNALMVATAYLGIHVKKGWKKGRVLSFLRKREGEVPVSRVSDKSGAPHLAVSHQKPPSRTPPPHPVGEEVATM